jgi:hypothetical protein
VTVAIRPAVSAKERAGARGPKGVAQDRRTASTAVLGLLTLTLSPIPALRSDSSVLYDAVDPAAAGGED